MTKDYANMEQSNLEQQGIIIDFERTCQDLREQQVVAYIEFDKEKQSLIAQIQEQKGQYEITKVQLNTLNPILHVKMNNRLNEFEELLLDNNLFKVQNQALGDKNLKWKEWWQIVQEFAKEQIQDNMELACSNDHSYQLELHAFQTIFPDFKYVKPPSFVYVEIGTSSTISAMPFVVQPITKLVSPLRGGMGLEIIPLLVQIFIILVPVTTIVSQLVEGSERFDKKQDELVNPSYIILNNRLESLEFLSNNVPLAPHQIGIS